MIPWALTRDSFGAADLTGAVLTVAVRDGDGEVLFDKGHVLRSTDAARLAAGAWEQLHVVRLEPGDLTESEAGALLARGVAGDGVAVHAMAGGQWPLRATRRGILAIDVAGLAGVNRHEELAVYTLFDGQVVEAGETVARAKVIPFALSAGILRELDRQLVASGPPIVVRGFASHRVSALVLESLGPVPRTRFRENFAAKVDWFGGRLVEIVDAPPEPSAVCDALGRLGGSSEIVVVAGSRTMDPLDPARVALGKLGAERVRWGMPAHPGSLCWVARHRETWIVGLPSCGVLSQATIFDLVLTWLFADMHLTADRLAAIGHGGLLTRDMAYRFPPYRATRARGEVE
jgi:hypothetical protein